MGDECARRARSAIRNGGFGIAPTWHGRPRPCDPRRTRHVSGMLDSYERQNERGDAETQRRGEDESGLISNTNGRESEQSSLIQGSYSLISLLSFLFSASRCLRVHLRAGRPCSSFNATASVEAVHGRGRPCHGGGTSTIPHSKTGNIAARAPASRRARTSALRRRRSPCRSRGRP